MELPKKDQAKRNKHYVRETMSNEVRRTKYAMLRAVGIPFSLARRMRDFRMSSIKTRLPFLLKQERYAGGCVYG